jgi:hypothetical protein
MFTTLKTRTVSGNNGLLTWFCTKHNGEQGANVTKLFVCTLQKILLAKVFVPGKPFQYILTNTLASTKIHKLRTKKFYNNGPRHVTVNMYLASVFFN